MSKPKTTSEVFHRWANDPEMHAQVSSVSCRFGSLYSYAACIARHLPDGSVAITTRSWSVTTSGHISSARQAIRHLKQIFVWNPEASVAEAMRTARSEVEDELEKAIRPRIRETTRAAHRAAALSIAENANKYAEAHGFDDRIDTSSFDAMKDSIEAHKRVQEQLRKEREEQRKRELADSMEKWRNHDILIRTGLYELPPILRLSKDENGEFVETSHNAKIPVGEAKRLWPLIKACKDQGREMSMDKQLGHYKLKLIRADGSIVVGCHDIAYVEIEGIAKQLGLLEVQHG